MYTFGEIWGSGRLSEHLRHAAQSGKISHAYLFLGGKGAGKRLIAHTFAKYLLCGDKSLEACGQCKSCKVFDSGNHPDVIHVTTEKRTLGVDEIREQILETVDLKPYHYTHKVYIIENAHTMTVQAQNALLKTLEEPPAYAVFLLLAEQEEAFLPTVLSRTVTMKISPLSEKEVGAYLEEKNLVPLGESELYAAYAQGRIGQALDLLQDEAFRQMREDILDKMEQLPRMSLAEALYLAKEWEAYKNDFRFLDMIGLWYRDLLVAKALKDVRFLIQKDKKEQIFAGAGESMKALAKKATAVNEAREHLALNANFRLTLEVMLMELKETTN